MIGKTKLLAAALMIAVPMAGITACDPGPDRVERWATTENTQVDINWDKVNQAYRDADGPEDFERRVNEIYEGDEIISVAVKDADDKSQVVTGFFDKNTNGTVDDGEPIFTIKREPTAEGARYQTTGYGHYAGYHSPFFDVMAGMVVGSMISNMFMPSYRPIYYTTSAARVGALQTHRTSYRAANPAHFGPRSKSGRNYGGGRMTKPSRPTSTGWGRRGGGSFGLRRAGRANRPRRLSE
jgi:hypothetical protein